MTRTVEESLKMIANEIIAPRLIKLSDPMPSFKGDIPSESLNEWQAQQLLEHNKLREASGEDLTNELKSFVEVIEKNMKYLSSIAAQKEMSVIYVIPPEAPPYRGYIYSNFIAFRLLYGVASLEDLRPYISFAVIYAYVK